MKYVQTRLTVTVPAAPFRSHKSILSLPSFSLLHFIPKGMVGNANSLPPPLEAGSSYPPRGMGSPSRCSCVLFSFRSCFFNWQFAQRKLQIAQIL